MKSRDLPSDEKNIRRLVSGVRKVMLVLGLGEFPKARPLGQDASQVNLQLERVFTG